MALCDSRDAAPAPPPAPAGDSRLRILLGCTHGIAFEVSRDGRFLEIWADDERLLCVPRQQALGRTVTEILGREMGDAFMPRVERVIDGGPPESFEYPLEVMAGPRWFLGDLVRIPSDDGGDATAALLARDITDDKRAWEERLRSEARFRGLIEDLPQGVCVVADGRILYANGHLAALVGADGAAQLVGSEVADLVDGADASRLAALVARAASAGSSPREHIRLGRRSRTQVVIEVASQRVTYGGPTSVLLLWRDLTEQRALQDRLMRSDRLASIGTLAAGMAHEINNPLSYVLGNIDAVLGDLESARQAAGALGESGLALADELGEFGDLLTEARKGAVRIRDIVRQLRVFSRSDEDSRSQVDLHDVLDASIQLAWNEIRHRARLVREWNQPPPVFASEARLGQVFLNLLINAAQAIGEGRAQANEIRVRTFQTADGRAGVTISDTGCGIPSERLGRIFDAFYTTKPVGVGTGLGLSICNSIIDRYGGTIDVESEPGRGTSFTVLLPAVPAPAKAAPAKAAPAKAAPAKAPPADPPDSDRATAKPFSTSLRASLDRTTRAARPITASDTAADAGLGARVLVVDDDALVARAASRILSREHDVTAVTSGVDALERISAGERFDVILCDLMMPEVTGMQLHAELSRLAPDQAERMILVSGGAFTAAARAFLDRVDNPRVDKPFDRDNLKDVVRSAAARARAQGDGGSRG